MSVLTTKFSLGDQVWKIQPTTEMIKLPCRFCHGRGWLDAKGANEESRLVKCPECDINATVTLGSWPQWRVEPEALRIGMIGLKVFDRKGEDNHHRADNMNPARVLRDHESDEETYMCWETGIGSGSVHYVEDLFATPEEAEEEAEQRTERARAGEAPGGRKDRWAQWWPDAQQVRVAAGFLDHREIYEHDAGHIALAQAILEVAARRKAQS
jgi:hypothetical protein